MNENSVSFPFTGRYYDNGVQSQKAQALLFVFHGYGQLSQYFIRKFEVLRERSVRVVAPEGLSRYYLEGSSGRVGASWMTRENRLVDIENYIAFINKIYQIEEDKIGELPITALGFSQGAATVSRWVTHSQIRFEHLILWAGLFPPDLKIPQSQKQLTGKRVSFVYGLNDPYLSDERFAEQEEIAQGLGVEPEVISFSGGHEIDPEVLHSLIV